jgi:ubiquinone/menaquinone biosynthesis C-methylase UbiE
MIFKQKENYQKIDGKKGRDCSERWNIMDKFMDENPGAFSIDIGSAEGYFTKKMVEKTKGRVISVEGSDHVYNRQLKYNENEIASGSVILVKMELTDKNLDLFLDKQYDNCLLLSVLHWFNNPDNILERLSAASKKVYIELPELDDKKAWNQPYLKYIADNFGSLDRYIEKVSGKKIISESKVSSHTSEYRRLFILS